MSSALRETIETHFSSLIDPRRVTKNQRHEFIDILTIALCGVICGANYWTAVAEFGQAKKDWFERFLKLPNGIPSHDVFTDVFAKLDSNSFERGFMSWTAALSEILPGQVIPIDGKTLRGSYDSASSSSAIHLVSAWSSENELVLGQYKTSEKSNEITAIPVLLEMLSLEQSLVTIDAMGCQKKIAQTIICRGADYLLAVKENQPTLYEAIHTLFFDTDKAELAELMSDHAVQENQGHGREEKRRCWTFDELSEWEELVHVWPGLQTFVVIESRRQQGDQVSVTYRFYISSKKQTAAYFLQASREHWHIENKLHWSLDVAFDEDAARVRQGHGAENLSILRRIALNLLKQEKTNKRGIETKRARAGWDIKYLETVLAGLST